MALQLSTTLRDNQAGEVETTIGTAPKLQIRTGAPPANCAAADSGTLLVELTLPSDWLTAPSSGAVSKSGTWEGTATGAGTAGHFRVKDSTGATAHMQGTVTATSGGGDMEVNNTNIAATQTVVVSSFSYTRGNA
jgi:hypothetical protein